MSMVKRVYVEKKPGFRVEAEGLLEELRDNLNLEALASVRVLHRYDLENLSEETYRRAVRRVLSEAPVKRRSFPHRIFCLPWNICRDSTISGRIPRCSVFRFWRPRRSPR